MLIKPITKTRRDLIPLKKEIWIGFFALYLENLGGTSQLKQVDRPSGKEGLKSDSIYRARIKGLINVLQRGGSTKAGITAIVAANLGIVGDDEAAILARNQIQILEFLPEPQTIHYTPRLLEEFEIENSNAVETVPEIRIRIGLTSDLPLRLTNPCFVNLTTGKSAKYQGTVGRDDVLSFFPNQTASLNGVPVNFEGETPALPPGESTWRFSAEVGEAEARFDRTLFDFSRFEDEKLVQPNPEQAAAFNLDIQITLSKLTPGSFMVRIPWDIPGFTNQLDELSDRPREQIKYIVNKVKAAGVFAVIAYEKQFAEIHDLEDSGIKKLELSGDLFQEEHITQEANFDISSKQTVVTVHEMSDAFTTSGVFDYTCFDSLNTFA